MQMECRTPTRKRSLSAMEPTSSPKRKKMKNVPVLRLNCTLSPGLQPILCSSALHFSIDSSSGSYQHQSYSQESYSQQLHSQQPPGLNPQNYRLPYYQSPNYQPPHYQPPYYQSSNYQLPNCQIFNYQSAPPWEECVERYQRASNANFMDMCQTSEAEASCSNYSSFSNRGGSFKDTPYAASTYATTPLPEKNGDDCEAIFRIVSECLTRVKKTLEEGQSTIDELIKLAPLLRATYSG
jgi:hypothetical protein